MPPDMTTLSASVSVSLLARLGTKPIAPRSIARMTSALRSDAETTTTGIAGQPLRSSTRTSKPSASPRRRSSRTRSKLPSAPSASRAARAPATPTTLTSLPMPWITFCSAVRISGWSSMRSTFIARLLSGVAAADGLGDADRLVRAFAFHRHLHGDLRAAFERLVGDQLEAPAQAAAAGHRRGKANLVQAVVDAHPRLAHPERRSRHLRQQREGEKAVRDRRAERTGLRALDVDVNPLVVVGGVGEELDPLLRHGDPVADADVLADELLQLGDRLECSHCVRRPQGRPKDADAPSGRNEGSEWGGISSPR